MSWNRLTGAWLSAFSLLFCSIFVVPQAGSQVLEAPEKVQPEPHRHADHGQAAEPTENAEPGPQQHHEHHHLHLPMGEAKCDPQFTYDEGPLGPSHWPGLCNAGKMQAPIDIEHAEHLRISHLTFKYQPADLDILNDCNQYRILVKFPDNYWLTVGKKPYNLTELHFRAPGENAVHGKRPRMSIQ